MKLCVLGSRTGAALTEVVSVALTIAPNVIFFSVVIFVSFSVAQSKRSRRHERMLQRVGHHAARMEIERSSLERHRDAIPLLVAGETGDQVVFQQGNALDTLSRTLCELYLPVVRHSAVESHVTLARKYGDL